MDSTSITLIFLVTFLVPVMISRFIMESAQKQLDSDMKVKLLDAFSAQRKFSLVISVAALVVYFLALKFYPVYAWLTIFVFGFFYLLFFVLKSIRNHKKIKELGIPETYLKKYRLSLIIVFAGFLAVAAEIVYVYCSQDDSYEGSTGAYDRAAIGVNKMFGKDYRDAMTDLKAAIELNPAESNFHLNLGTCYYHLGMIDSAISEYEKAVALDNDSLANFYLQLSVGEKYSKEYKP